MFALLETMLRLLAQLSGAVAPGSGDAQSVLAAAAFGAAGFGVAGLAALAAASCIRAVAALAAARTPGATWPSGGDAVVPRVPSPQADPDAAGHSRPRAPSLLLPAA